MLRDKLTYLSILSIENSFIKLLSGMKNMQTKNTGHKVLQKYARQLIKRLGPGCLYFRIFSCNVSAFNTYDLL